MKQLPPPNPDNRGLTEPFSQTVNTFPRDLAPPISLRWLRRNKVGSSAAPAAAVAVRGSCARRERPSSSVGVVVLHRSVTELQTPTPHFLIFVQTYILPSGNIDDIVIILYCSLYSFNL